MATRKKASANRTTLVEGCGTILKTNRLKGGYKLTKRKRVAGATTSTATIKLDTLQLIPTSMPIAK